MKVSFKINNNSSNYVNLVVPNTWPINYEYFDSNGSSVVNAFKIDSGYHDFFPHFTFDFETSRPMSDPCRYVFDLLDILQKTNFWILHIDIFHRPRRRCRAGSERRKS